jgi:glucose-6-phosphate 1-dehydrogenase
MFRLFSQGRLPDGFAIIAIGRRDKSRREFRNEMRDFMTGDLGKEIDDALWENFKEKIIYFKMNFLEDGGYVLLNGLSVEIDKDLGTKGNRIYYLATAPGFFEIIIKKLHANGMLENRESWQRVMIEKPFGSDLRTATELNENITKLISEDGIFRIDHYLGKEMIQNILSLRFGNSIFEPLWNHNYIDHIQIISTETLGVGSRGGYYDDTGIVKDMLQNHILQMLTLIAMEPPVNLKAESIRDEKVKVLQALRPFAAEDLDETVAAGQYGAGNGFLAYRDEDRVADDSETDTFIAVKTCIDNFRWGGVPIYIFAGKRMKSKTTRIIIRFKKLPGINFYEGFSDTEANVLVIRIQPDEGLFFRINAKNPGNDFTLGNVDLDYCQDCGYEGNSPEAYERLIIEAINDNKALFTRWDELEYSWKYIDSLYRARIGRKTNYPNYTAGGAGPASAYELIERDGRSWWEEEKNGDT